MGQAQGPRPQQLLSNQIQYVYSGNDVNHVSYMTPYKLAAKENVMCATVGEGFRENKDRTGKLAG